MATKRDLASMTESERDQSSPAPSIKRARNADPQRMATNTKQQQQQQQQQEPATDVTYGQRYCFPGLNGTVDHSDEDLEFEDETDALAYLSQQASAIPHLLVAPRSGPQLPRALAADELDDGGGDEPVDRSIYESGHGDTRGYYEDGAYTAAPDDALNPEGHGLGDHGDDETTRIDAAYFDSLASRFLSLRTRLRRPPPPGSLVSLAREQSPHVGRFGRDSRTFTVWSVRMRHSDPHPAQIAAMDKGAVLRLLRVLLGGKFLRSGVELRERTSRWLWALLARLPDRGELDHTEVGHVRELGKRAALLMHTLREMAMLREEVELGVHDEDADAEEWIGEDEGGSRSGGEGEAEAEMEPRHEPDKEHGQGAPPPGPASDHVGPSSVVPTGIPEETGKVPEETGKADEDMEDGEIADVRFPTDPGEDIESAKARLLASLDVAGSSSEADPAADSGSQDAGLREESALDPARARMNMRATLNMILTVAGEFYGQRDLLEFRDPFHGI